MKIMRISKLFIFVWFIVSLLFASCNEEIDDVCSSELWAGVWKGELICNGGVIRFPGEYEITLNEAFYTAQSLSTDPCYIIFSDETLIDERDMSQSRIVEAGRLSNDTLIFSYNTFFSGSGFIPNASCIGYFLKE